jgi:hypothetical protein
VERWHQTLQDEFLDDAGPFASIEDAQAAVSQLAGGVQPRTAAPVPGDGLPCGQVPARRGR